MFNDLISVIVTVYNKGRFLKKCIDSIENNSYKNFELIIVEDCSTDNSMEVINGLISEYPDIQLIKNPINMGAGISRDIGVKHSKGKWISFIDADDSIKSDFYETYLQRVEDEDVEIDIVFGGCNVSFEESPKRYKLYQRENKLYIGTDECIINLVEMGFHYLPISLIRRKLFEGIEYCHSRFIEDTPTSYLLLSNANNILTIDYSGYNYLQVKSSLMHTHKPYLFDLYFSYNMIPVIEYIKGKDEELSEKIYSKIYKSISKYSMMYGKDYDDIKEDFNGIDEIIEYYNLSKETMTEQKNLSNRLTKTRVVRIR